MKQTNKLDNACGIIACIHTIANNFESVELSSQDTILAKFISSCKDKSPQQRFEMLEVSNEFKTAHTQFATLGRSDLCSNRKKSSHTL